MATAFAAATSSTAIAGVLPRLPTTTTPRCSALPQLPARSFSTSIKHVSGSRRSSVFQIKASEDASADPNELFNDLKEKWDALENKSTVIVYGGGAVVAIWLSSIVVGAINSVPLLPKILELVGLGYTGWFVYRYLLFKKMHKSLSSSSQIQVGKIVCLQWKDLNLRGTPPDLQSESAKMVGELWTSLASLKSSATLLSRSIREINRIL